MPDWDAKLYLKFKDERTQPSKDLVSRINLSSAERIIDIGCGPGNSTGVLASRWPDAKIGGFDSSPDMIEKAQAAYPSGEWFIQDVTAWQPDTSYDIVFSNAVLQWIPDHHTLFPRLMESVAPGGVLAVQMPAHFQSPFHQALLEVADMPMWSDKMTEAKVALDIQPSDFYYSVLAQQATKVDLWLTEYFHPLDSVEEIINWFRSTRLRSFFEKLDTDQQRQLFEQELLERCRIAYPAQADGKVLLGIQRLFMVAYR